MVKVPDSTQSSLEWKLRARARDRWPDLQSVSVKHRAGFAYVTGHLSDGEVLPLCRLRYVGSAAAGALRSTAPATTTTKKASSPPTASPAPPKKPSTPPAASTSATPPPGDQCRHRLAT